MNNEILFRNSFLKLKDYCEKNNFKGWDPYDGLNSKIFQMTPLRNSSLARLILIQTFKRSPINLRKLLFVPKQYNAKGIALFLTGYCNLFKSAKGGNNDFGTPSELLENINYLAELLISMQNCEYSGSCWGYNFDWQSRRLFLFPKETPTVVATSFAVTALFEAFEITKNKKYFETAVSAGEFVLSDLNRTIKNEGYIFSYSPLKGNNEVYNASLLGSKILSLCYHYSGKEKYKEAARQSVVACVNEQRDDGSWFYGELETQKWIDSFHTGYNLDALSYYQKLTGDKEFQLNIDRGFDYYISIFFTDNGVPKYYHNKTFPIDIHCPGQLIVTLFSLNKLGQYNHLLEKVLSWTINNMQDRKGYYYYQKRKGVSSKISYMRWSQAFMFYSISHYFIRKIKQQNNFS